MNRTGCGVVGCLGFGFILAWILLLWVVPSLFLPYDPKDHREAAVVEQEAVQHLSQALQKQPSTTVRISYTHDGSRFGGIVGHHLIYDPVRGSLQDWFEYGDPKKPVLELAGVLPNYIHRIAQAGGLLDDLRPLPGVRVIHDDPDRYRYLPKPKKRKTGKPGQGSASRASSPPLHAALPSRFPAGSILKVRL